MSDPLEPVQKLGEQLKRVAQDLGLELQQFFVIPDMSGGAAHMAQAVFMVDAADVLPAPEADSDLAPHDPELGAQFDEIIHGANKAAEEAKTDDAKDAILALKQRIEGGGPILGGDES